MTAKVIQRNNENATILFSKIYVVLTLIAHAFCIYKYMAGAAYAFGAKVSVIKAIEMVFEVLSISGNHYRGICNTILGLLYIAILVFMIKNFISSLYSIEKIFKDKYLTKNSKYKILSYGEKIHTSFLLTIAYTFACITVKSYTLPTDIYIIIIIWALITLLKKLVCYLEENYSYATITARITLDIITIISIILVVSLTQYPVIEELFYAIKGISVLPKQAFVAMIMPILYGILIFLAFIVMDQVGKMNTVIQSYEMRDYAKKLVYTSIALSIGAIIVLALNGYTSHLDFQKIVTLFRPYISIICASLATMIMSMSPNDHISKSNFDDQNTHLYTVDDNGILLINYGVTAILPSAFQGRTDIKEVYIPASVVSIEEGAFSGCTQITKIYCSCNVQPSTWSPKWAAECPARIEWIPLNETTHNSI